MPHLDDIQVATPCSASWDAMEGDDRARYCEKCHLHVYNLSGMSRREAEDLVQRTEGRLCVRFYRRSDGKILTEDCPVGVRAQRMAARWMIRFVHVFAAFFIIVLGHSLIADGVTVWLRQTEPFATLIEWIDPRPSHPSRVFMGKRCVDRPIGANALQGQPEKERASRESHE
jgi:hypothetical protein